MSLTLRISGSIVFVLFVVMGLVVASSHLLPLISLGALVALSALGLRREEQRPASGSSRGSAWYAGAVVAGVVVVSYAAIGMVTLLGGAALALAGASALAYLGYRRLQRGSAHAAEQITGGGPGAVGPGPPNSRSTGKASTSKASTSKRSPNTGSSDAAAADTRSRGLLPADPTALSIDELCRAWRVSYLVLQNAPAPEAVEQLAQLRCRYLDELSRRHPEGFRRWLDDGARAAGDPSRYVRERSRGPCWGKDTKA